MRNDSETGDMVEKFVEAEFLSFGLSVFEPVSDNLPYDLLVENGGEYYKVQCKHGRYDESSGKVNAALCCYSSNQRTKIYTEDEVDYFAIYCHQIDELFIVPFEDAPSQNMNIHIEGEVLPQHKDRINHGENFKLPESEIL